MAKEVLMSYTGLKALEEELDQLKSVKRREVSQKIKVALSFGDLSENSEYDAAKNEQAFVEARIAQLERMLANARVLDHSSLDENVAGIGRIVKLRDIEFDEEEEYAIVSANEASVSEGRVSDESPVGKAITGHSVGEIVNVETPSGIIQYEILEIRKNENL